MRSDAAAASPQGAWWRRPFWRRPWVDLLVGAGVTAALLSPLLADAVAPHSSLDVFVRAATEEELSLIPALERLDGEVTMGPRILEPSTESSVAEDVDGRPVIVRTITAAIDAMSAEIAVLGYLARLDRPGRLPVDLVCLVAVERASLTDAGRAPALGESDCVTRETFDDRGIETAIDGIAHRFAVAWGPVGALRIEQLGDASGESGPTVDDGPRLGDLLATPVDASARAIARMIDPSGDVIAAGPVRVASTKTRTVHLYRANPDSMVDGQRLCLVAMSTEAVTDSLCVAETLASRAGMTLQYLDGVTLVTVTVGSTGTAFTEENRVG